MVGCCRWARVCGTVSLLDLLAVVVALTRTALGAPPTNACRCWYDCCTYGICTVSGVLDAAIDIKKRLRTTYMQA